MGERLDRLTAEIAELAANQREFPVVFQRIITSRIFSKRNCPCIKGRRFRNSDTA